MKNVMITGATGAVGSQIVPRILNEQETQVTLIVRSRSVEHLEERKLKLLNFWKLNPESDKAKRLTFVIGDVSVARLGLPQNIYRELAGSITHIIHCAGNVKFNQTLAEARKSAVTGTEEILAFAEQCRANGQLRKVDVTSTVGVAGRMRGVLPEERISTDRAYHNTYEETKAESEILYFEAIDKGLPLTIHRPSMVVGDSKDGQIIQFQIFYHIMDFYSGKRSMGLVPDAGEFKLDIIPVDYVAEAICIASNDLSTAGRIFHLCSGPERSLRLHQLVDDVRGCLEKQGIALKSLYHISLTLYLWGLRGVTGLVSKKRCPMLHNLPLFLTYLADTQDFDNTSSNAYFTDKGLPIPPVGDYLERVMGYFQAKSMAA